HPCVKVMNVSFLRVTSKVSASGANAASPLHSPGSYSKRTSRLEVYTSQYKTLSPRQCQTPSGVPGGSE
ncbi:hypothetical protein JOQ06_010838, partial [Pogonophryne albipinna]